MKKEDEENDKSFIDFLKHKPTRPDALIWLVDTYTESEKLKESEAVVTIIEADENFPEQLKYTHTATSNLTSIAGPVDTMKITPDDIG